MPENKENIKLSIVVPFYNESNTVAELHSRLLKVLNDKGDSFEIVFVDDGSLDDTFSNIKKLHPVKIISLRKKSGQSAAISMGIKKSQGAVVVILDSDLENHPEDIPVLLKKIDEGYDLVSGWRKKRWSSQPFSRRLPSILANKLISFVSGIKLHDHGCSLKAYRREYLSPQCAPRAGEKLPIFHPGLCNLFFLQNRQCLLKNSGVSFASYSYLILTHQPDFLNQGLILEEFYQTRELFLKTLCFLFLFFFFIYGLGNFSYFIFQIQYL